MTDTARIDQIIGNHNSEASSLIQILLDIQGEFNWLPPAALARVGEKLNVPQRRIRHIATFYKAFSLVPMGDHRIHVCMGTACHIRGAERILETVQDQIGIRPGETDPDLKYSLETVNCLGCCALGPVMDIDGKIHGKLSVSETTEVLKRF